MNIYNFYIDDSGTRQPDRKTTAPPHGNDWFALGGVLIHEDQESRAREKIADLVGKWGISFPLHSSEIRAKSGNFSWLRDKENCALFLGDLQHLLCELDTVGLACVIDRPGYNKRYEEKYGRKKWTLCKTAFSIVVERAARFAASHDARLRVFVERSDKDGERALKRYYDEMRGVGMPFDPQSSAKYTPLPAANLAQTLYDFKVKQKSSPLMQIADLYLYPLCRGGYESTYAPFQALISAGRLIEASIDPNTIERCGTKYSCFEKTKA